MSVEEKLYVAAEPAKPAINSPCFSNSFFYFRPYMSLTRNNRAMHGIVADLLWCDGRCIIIALFIP